MYHDFAPLPETLGRWAPGTKVGVYDPDGNLKWSVEITAENADMTITVERGDFICVAPANPQGVIWTAGGPVPPEFANSVVMKPAP
jgi:hypothetical protein